MDLMFKMLLLWFIGLLSRLIWEMIIKGLMINAETVNFEATETFLEYTVIKHMMTGYPCKLRIPFNGFSAILCMTLYFLRYRSSTELAMLFSKCWGKCNRQMEIARKCLHSKTHFRLRIGQLPITYPCALNQYVNELVEHGRANMKYEWARYISFKSFPINSVMTPMRLAEAGFYYTDKEQEVKCFCCGITNGEWTCEETAVQLHKRISPNCKFIRGEDTENISIHSTSYNNDTFSGDRTSVARNMTESTEGTDYSVTRVSFENSNIVSSNSANDSNNSVPIPQENAGSSGQVRTQNTGIKHPEFADLAKRIATFADWPRRDIQDPTALAQAGLFFTGTDDSVRCFHCGGSLRDWERGDIPWDEHARWYPSCGHLLNNIQVSPSLNLPKPDMPHVDLSSSRGTTGSQKQTMTALKSQQLSLQEEVERLSSKHRRLKVKKKSLQAEIERLKHHHRCKICLDAEANTVFLPCGHLVACESCARKLKKCGVCRRIIKGSVRTYMS